MIEQRCAGADGRRGVLEAVVLSALNGFKSGSLFLAAVSGGADSTALFYSLVRLRASFSGGFHCVHIQHNLRGDESRADERAVVNLCRRFDVPCTVRAIPEGGVARFAQDKGCGIEAAARELRYSLLKEEARRLGAAALLTAHTRDDFLETVLMRCLRGAGPAGLAAIPARNGLIIRPLLTVRRLEILRYLEEHDIAFRVDSTNISDHYMRGRIRHRLVPVLNDFFPGWDNNLLRMAETQRVITRYLKLKCARILKRNSEYSDNSIVVRNFFSLPQIMREELIFNTVNEMAKRRGEEDVLFMPDPPVKQNTIPRRVVVRRFAKGVITNADIGCAALKAEGNDLHVNAKYNGVSGTGSVCLF